MPPTSSLTAVKEEIALALNDTSDPPRDVKPDSITLYKRTDGKWSALDDEDKTGKRARESTLEDNDILGVGSGSTIDEEGEMLGYTVKGGLEGEETMEI